MPLLAKNPNELSQADVLEWQFDGWMSDWRPGERIAISRPKWPCGCSVFVALVSVPAFGLLANNLVGWGWLSLIVGGLLGGVFMFRWWHGPWSHIVMDFGQDLLQVNSAFSSKKHALSSVHRLRITTKQLETGADTPVRYSATLLALTDSGSVPLGTTYVEGTEGENAITLLPMAATLANCLNVRFDVPDHLESDILKLTDGTLESLRVNDDATREMSDTNDQSLDETHERPAGVQDVDSSDQQTEIDEAETEDDLDPQGEYGIDEWAPGQKVRTRTDGSRWRDLIVVIIVSFVGSLIGIGLLIYLYHNFVAELSETLSTSLHLVLANLVSCFFVWRAYKPALDVEIDWEKETVDIFGGSEKQQTYSIDDVRELELSGELTSRATMKEQGINWPYPPRWQTFLHIVMEDGEKFPLLTGTKFTGSEFDTEEGADEATDGPQYDHQTAQLSYDEMLEPTAALAESLDVDWTWAGFKGDANFEPDDE